MNGCYISELSSLGEIGNGQTTPDLFAKDAIFTIFETLFTCSKSSEYFVSSCRYELCINLMVVCR